MNKTIKILLTAALLMGAGCRSLTPTELLAVFGSLAGSAAYGGACYAIAQDPGARIYFETAQQALAGLLNRGDYDPAKAAAVMRTLLDRLNTDALRDDTAALLVGETLVVFDVARQELIDMQQAPAWTQVVMSAIESGFRRALEQPARRGAKQPPSYPVPRP